MYKIKNAYIDNMIAAKLSNSEICFILHIAKYQDDYGCVHSVYYKDVCQFLGISTQKFYDIIHSLSNYNLIKVSKSSMQGRMRRDICIQLIGNDFSNTDYQEVDVKNAYIKVDSFNFTDSRFVNTKAGSKLLFLYMQRFTKGKHLGVQKFYENFCALFGVSKKTLQVYMHELKVAKLLGISKKRNKAYHYEMTLKATKTINKSCAHEKDTYKSNIRKAILINFNEYIPSTEIKKFLDDVTNLLDRKVTVTLHKEMPEILMNAISISVIRQKKENKKNISLNAAFTNKIFTELLNNYPYFAA